MELSWVLFLLPQAIAYNLPSLLGQPVTSHSGPDVQIGEAENSHHREKRAYNYWWSHSQYQYSNNLLVSSEPPDAYLQKWITYEHNRYRRIVPATDMRMLYWSDELAASAQRHADTCDFRHSRGRVNVGENIWAAPYSNYSDAMRIWFDEVYNPRCQCNHAYKHCCGHYVQMVWARTSLVGCGFARCADVQGVWGRGHRAVFVCHYNPQGNTVFVTRNRQLYAMPAFTWATAGKDRCSDCPSDAPACYQGLCYKPSITSTTTTTQRYDSEDSREDEYTQDEEQQQQRTTVDENNNIWRKI